jgi:hypothetical protein
VPLIELELVVAAEHVVRGGLGQHRRDLELVARPQLLQLLRRPSVVVTWAAAAEEEALRVRPPPLPPPPPRLWFPPDVKLAPTSRGGGGVTVQLDLLDGDHVAHVDAALLRAELLRAESLRADLEQPATEILREAVPVERSVGQHKQPLDPVRPHSGCQLAAPLVKRRCDTDELVWVNVRDLFLQWLESELHSRTLGFLNRGLPAERHWSTRDQVVQCLQNSCAAPGWGR